MGIGERGKVRSPARHPSGLRSAYGRRRTDGSAAQVRVRRSALRPRTTVDVYGHCYEGTGGLWQTTGRFFERMQTEQESFSARLRQLAKSRRRLDSIFPIELRSHGQHLVRHESSKRRDHATPGLCVRYHPHFRKGIDHAANVRRS